MNNKRIKYRLLILIILSIIIMPNVIALVNQSGILGQFTINNTAPPTGLREGIYNSTITITLSTK
ncbi:MAG: hypothetical protein KAU20_02170 [Nanoarchaeota archaeon]|nr:hypothetical protein [Nanoarchaeota archaeon]